MTTAQADRAATGQRKKHAHDLGRDQTLVMRMPIDNGAGGIAFQEITVTLLHKSGQRARLNIEASPSVTITKR
jgi:hypothetical protein